MFNLTDFVVGALQAGANGVAMYWGVKLATRLEKKNKAETKDDTKQDGAGVKSQDDRNNNTVNRGDRDNNL